MKEKDKLILIDERMDKMSKGLSEVRVGICQYMKNAIFRLVRFDNFYQLIPIAYEEKEGLVQRPLWLIVRSLPRKVRQFQFRSILSRRGISLRWASRR